ncbi:glutathione S-transferase N-terminal domain-containing protein [Gammaproteobacteria bacterium]|nr:glutathione S-transferase N-terminal domain-containing protein [Gammaproteobacteria bacterium]
MKLYDLSPSPNARRVRIFIAEKGLDIPIVPVNMMTGENQTKEYLDKNPLGMMPVLELDDGTCISESATICRYLEETNPNPSLMGNDALDRALVDMWHRNELAVSMLYKLTMLSIFDTLEGLPVKV